MDLASGHVSCHSKRDWKRPFVNRRWTFESGGNCSSIVVDVVKGPAASC